MLKTPPLTICQCAHARVGRLSPDLVPHCDFIRCGVYSIYST